MRGMIAPAYVPNFFTTEAIDVEELAVTISLLTAPVIYP